MPFPNLHAALHVPLAWLRTLQRLGLYCVLEALMASRNLVGTWHSINGVTKYTPPQVKLVFLALHTAFTTPCIMCARSDVM
jgi:hypothetical protein